MIPIAKPIIGEEEKRNVMEVLNSGMLAQGPKVKELEEKFAKYCGTKHAICVNSGTAALHCALYACGIKEGDEVITVPFTFVASANPVLMQNAKIVFCDVDKDSFNIDPKKVEEKITPKTKAIIGVDLYGQTCDYTALRKIAQMHNNGNKDGNIKIIEDACQAHGASLGKIKAGKLGDIACFSLYATKNMMSGEGGIITTDDDNFAELCRRFRHHGQSEQTRYQYFDLGYNYRLTDLCAAIALAQLDKLENYTAIRIENAKMLSLGLSKIKGIKVPAIQKNCRHVFHQYTIIVEEDFPLSRDALMEKLKENGIGCAVFYPKPLHLHPHFAKFGYKEGDFPVSESLAKKVLSLPVNPSVTKDDIKHIIDTIAAIK